MFGEVFTYELNHINLTFKKGVKGRSHRPCCGRVFGEGEGVDFVYLV